jgi:hypothetical protein
VNGLTASLLVALGCAAGCASGEQATPAGELARRTLGGADHGLAVHRWIVEDEASVIAAALDRHSAVTAGAEPESPILARNGLRMVSVALSDVSALRRDLGGTKSEVEGWHGQITDWREVAAFPLGAERRAVAAAGSVRRLEGGRLVLLMRGWTVPMEDGPRFELQLVPIHEREPENPLARIAGVASGEREPLFTADLLLEPDRAYVLTSITPSEEEAPKPGAERAEGEEDGPAPPPGGATHGPAAPVPRTVGEMLFRAESPRDSDVSRAPPQRTLLIFVPRIPAELRVEAVSAAERP